MDIENAKRICERLMEFERECGRLILRANDIATEEKIGKRDIVTKYDCQIQEILMKKISEAVPGAGFYGEEQEERDSLDGENVFIIDPIDGTMNFVHHINHSCISVAYSHRGEICAAAVYDPYVDEMYSAVKGGGAYLNGKRISVDDNTLENSLAICNPSLYGGTIVDRAFELSRLAFDACLDLRRTGCGELDLCSVAAGKVGLFFELYVKLWDYAAGTLLIEEAGGTYCTIDGGKVPFDGSRPSLVAGGKQQVREFLELIEKHDREKAMN